MRKILNLLALSLLLTGCNACKSSPVIFGDKADLSIFMNQMNSDLQKIGQPIITEKINYYVYRKELAPQQFKYEGYCSTVNGEKHISLSVDLNDIGVSDYLTFVHEIGHCIYNKKHDDSKPNIMTTNRHPDVFNQFKIESERLRLIREMINN